MNDETTAAELIIRGETLRVEHLSGRALAAFERAIALCPTNSAGWRGRGAVRLDQGATDDALADFTRAIDIDPGDPANWLARGDGHVENDDHARAIADYTRAIDLDPRQTHLYDRRASAYVVQLNFEQASADYDRMIAIDRDNPLPFARRSELYSFKNDLDPAIAECNRAIGLAPRSEYYLQRSRLHARRGHHQAALADLAEAIRVDPNSPEAFDARRRIWTTLGNRERANADYDEALRLGAIVSGEFRRKLGMAYAREGDHERAIAEFTGAIANYDAILRMFSGDARLLYRRGLLRLTAGDEAGGNSDIAAATAIDANIQEKAVHSIG